MSEQRKSEKRMKTTYELLQLKLNSHGEDVMPEINRATAGVEAATLTTEDVENITLLGLDDIENMNFNDIEDPPGFINPPDGVYRLKITKAAIATVKVKPENRKEGEPDKKKIFRHFYEIMEVKEIDDAAEQKPKIGDRFSETFQVNEEGIKYWKGKSAAILGKELGKVTVGNVLKELTDGGYEFDAKIANKESIGKEGTANAGKPFKNTNVRVIAKAKDIPGMEGAAGTIATGQNKDVAVE